MRRTLSLLLHWMGDFIYRGKKVYYQADFLPAITADGRASVALMCVAFEQALHNLTQDERSELMARLLSVYMSSSGLKEAAVKIPGKVEFVASNLGKMYTPLQSTLLKELEKNGANMMWGNN